jgi:hypothetical protein
MDSLTPEDIQFFSDEENWMSGPTYDLDLTVAATDLKALQEAISSSPGISPWEPRAEWSRSILRPRDDSFRPVGLFHIHRVRDAVVSYRLVIYPPSMKHACGLEIWQNPKSETSILALRDLHESLLELVRWINARVLVLRSSVFDETNSEPQLEDAQGFLWMFSDLASQIGWTGRTFEHWTGIPL